MIISFKQIYKEKKRRRKTEVHYKSDNGEQLRAPIMKLHLIGDTKGLILDEEFA